MAILLDQPAFGRRDRAHRRRPHRDRPQRLPRHPPWQRDARRASSASSASATRAPGSSSRRTRFSRRSRRRRRRSSRCTCFPCQAGDDQVLWGAGRRPRARLPGRRRRRHDAGAPRRSMKPFTSGAFVGEVDALSTGGTPCVELGACSSRTGRGAASRSSSSDLRALLRGQPRRLSVLPGRALHRGAGAVPRNRAGIVLAAAVVSQRGRFFLIQAARDARRPPQAVVATAADDRDERGLVLGAGDRVLRPLPPSAPWQVAQMDWPTPTDPRSVPRRVALARRHHKQTSSSRMKPAPPPVMPSPLSPSRKFIAILVIPTKSEVNETDVEDHSPPLPPPPRVRRVRARVGVSSRRRASPGGSSSCRAAALPRTVRRQAGDQAAEAPRRE